MSTNNNSFMPIAITGVASLFADAYNPQQFWRNITQGKDLITETPASHWLIEDHYDPDPKAADKIYCKRGSFLPDVAFNPVEYGIPPNVLEATDSTQLLSLVMAKQVLQDASKGDPTNINLENVSVILGVTSAQELVQYASARLQRPIWRNALREQGLAESAVEEICDRISSHYVPWQENTFPGLLGNVVAGRIANRFNLGGTNCVLDAACASSLAAFHLAVQELQLHRSNLVICGGADTLNDVFMFTCFSKTPALSPTGDARAFSAQADGTVLGEGLAFFTLKRLEDAERDNDQIYAVIRGLGTSSDGRGKSIYAPAAQGQSMAIKRALEQANFPADSIELIEGHGTSTKAGDTAEFDGLKLAFADVDAQQQCALGSIKSQIGHTKAAAGAAGLFKAVMALQHKTLPGTIKVEQPNPKFNIEQTPFYVNSETRPWVRNKTHPRRAGVSSFGFGGSNFHVCVEEYTGPNKAKRLRSLASELITLTADNPAELIKQCNSLEQQLTADTSLPYLAYQSQQQLDSNKPLRLAIVAHSEEDLANKAQQSIKLLQEKASFAQVKEIYYADTCLAGDVAFVFPGQGSQYINMGSDLAQNFDEAINCWEQAADFDFGDKALHEVVFPIPGFDAAQTQANQQNLTATEWAQPALAITNQSYFNLLTTLGLKPDCVAGHSFGEISALFAANSIDANSLLEIAYQRGQIMAGNADGSMLAVVAHWNDISELLKDNNIDIMPANFNSPKQTVLSGKTDAIAEAEKLLTQHKYSCIKLNVSNAFHSSLVAHCRKPFYHYLLSKKFAKPTCPVYANLTAQSYTSSEDKMKTTLADQLLYPVRFQEEIQTMYQAGVRIFVEVGPHNVLSKLIQQILVDKTDFVAINLDKKGQNSISCLWQGLGKLFSLGVNLDFAALWQQYKTPFMTNGKKAAKHTVMLNGTCYGKPYPRKNGAQGIPKPNAKPATTATHTSKQTVNQPLSTTTLRRRTNHMSNEQQQAYLAQTIQQQLVAAHNTYQKAMAESHMSFLNTIALISQAPGTNVPMPIAQPAMQMPVPAPTFAAPAAPMPAAMPAFAAPAAPAPAFAAPTAPAPVFTAPAPMPVAPASVTPAPVAAAPVPPVASALPLNELILAVVAEKTGYPQEMIEMDMELEADLSIDSIKRVEILAAIQEQLPNLPNVNATEMAELKTLAEIMQYLDKMRGNESAPKTTSANTEKKTLESSAI